MVAESIAAEIDVIATLYELREPDAVRLFLKRNSFLLEVLECVRPDINRIFGNHILHVFLQTQYDVEEQLESLWILVQVRMERELARASLDRLDREVWAKLRRPFFGKIDIDIELGQPVYS